MYDILGVRGHDLQKNLTLYMDFNLRVHVFSNDCTCRCDDVSVQCM